MGEMNNRKKHIMLRNATLTRWNHDELFDWGRMAGLKKNYCHPQGNGR